MKRVPLLSEGCISTSTMSSVFAIADVLRSLLFLNSVLLMSSSSLGMAPTSELPSSSSREEYINPSSCVTAFINTTYTDQDDVNHTSNNESGKYGETYVGPAFGVLIHVRSKENEEPTACSLPLITFSTRDYKLPTSEPWIALIKRGHCDFAVKVMNALRSNASAVLIYNDREAPTLDKMSIPSNLRNISAVFTFKKKGESLAALVDSGVRVMTYITVGNPCSKPSTNINRLRPFVSSSLWFVPPPENVYKENKSAGVPDDDLNGSGTSVLFVSISFIVLMIISLAWLVFYYVQRFRYIHAKDRLSRRLCSAAKKALSKIPTKNIKSEDKEIQGDGECCAVCIEPYKISDVLRILPCRHEFHKFCIDPWLLEHRTCPMCKMDILKHYGFVFTGSQESILHMEIEEVAGLGSGVNNDTDRLQRRTLSPATQIRPSEHQVSSSASPEVHSRSSRASSPDELTPTLCSEQCYMGATSQTGESPSLMETLTQYSSATADALQKPGKCSNCLGITFPESAPTASSICVTNYKCNCELRQTPSCDIEDCELESCDSLTASLNTSPSHENSVKAEQATRVFSGK